MCGLHVLFDVIMHFSLWVLIRSLKAIGIVQILFQFSNPMVLRLWDIMET